MNFANLDEMMAKNQRKIDLFGTDNFRCWMLNFVPGDGTDMHYHANPESFFVVSGNGVVKGLKGEERAIKKNEIVFLAAKDYYQLTNTGTNITSRASTNQEGFYAFPAVNPGPYRIAVESAGIK